MGVMALAWFAGFIFLPAPGGLGAREYLIMLFLTPELLPATDGVADHARALAILVAVVMRLMTLVVELLASASLYWLPGPGKAAPPPGGGVADVAAAPSGETL
jgi:uncharacterized membrane protein YbhN (UPF0104 family)